VDLFILDPPMPKNRNTSSKTYASISFWQFYEDPPYKTHL